MTAEPVARARAVTSAEMTGRWRMVATSNGLFDLRPNVADASIEYQPAVDGYSRYRVDYVIGRRSSHFSGRARTEPTKRRRRPLTPQLFAMVATQMAWQLRQTLDGRVAAIHNPGSMLSDPGCVLLGRNDVDQDRIRREIELSYFDLGLTSQQFLTLNWRAAPTPPQP